MKFTGRNLELVRDSLRMALQELHNRIATCPNVYEFDQEIQEIEEVQKDVKKLLARIHARHPELLFPGESDEG